MIKIDRYQEMKMSSYIQHCLLVIELNFIKIKGKALSLLTQRCGKSGK